jgi:hypothetical protein
MLNNQHDRKPMLQKSVPFCSDPAYIFGFHAFMSEQHYAHGFLVQVERNGSGKWVEVGTGEEAAGMERRYIMNAAVQDFSGQHFVNVFNEQAALMLGHSADDLHQTKVWL